MNIIFWTIYYIKCGINIILAKIFNYFKSINTHKPKKNVNKKELSDYLFLINLEGTYYEMGKQYGTLMKEIILRDNNKFINFMKSTQSVYMKRLNPIIKNKLQNNDVIEACYNMYLNCLYFLPQDITDYFKGVSEGADIDLKELITTNFFYELMENHCIMYAKKTDKGLLGIRTLDLCSPILAQSLTVFNPKGKNKYITLGHSFVLGAATMISEKGLILGESFYDYNLGKDQRMGIPFYLLFHQIMSEANNIVEAKDIMREAKRIGNLQISVFNYLENDAVIYNYSSCNLIKNQKFSSNTSVIYSVTPGEKERFEKHKNDFNNAEEAIHKMLPMVKSGELHVMIYHDNYIYVSVTTDIIQSYNNNFTKLNLKDLFSD